MSRALIIAFEDLGEFETAAGEHRPVLEADRMVGDDRLLKMRVPADAPDDLYERLAEAHDLRDQLSAEVVNFFDAIW